MRNLGRKLLTLLMVPGLGLGAACTSAPGEAPVDAFVGDAESSDAADAAESAWVVPGNFQATLETPSDDSVILAGEPLVISGTVFHSVQELGTLQVTIVSETAGTLGVIAPALDGTFSFEWNAPRGGYAGDQKLSVQAVDQKGAIATVTTKIRVNSPPSVPELSIGPIGATTLDDLSAMIVTPSTDLEGDEITYSFRWLKNQEAFYGTAGEIPNTNTERGDLWTVFVRAEDSYHESDETSVSIQIANTPPSLESCTVVSGGIGVTATLTCVGNDWADPDGDPIFYDVRWHKEQLGEQVFVGTGLTFPGEGLVKGDKVICSATPKDEYDAGAEVFSEPVVIENSSPVIAGVSLLPESPLVNTPVTCSAESIQDADVEDSESLTVSIEWLINGLPAKATTMPSGVFSQQLTPAQLGAGKVDNLSCTITAIDLEGSATKVTAETIAVVNAPPTAEVVQVVAPDGVPSEEDTLECQFEGIEDPDEDLVSTIVFWDINDHDVLEGGAKVTGNTLSNEFFSKGDEVRCALLLDDGTTFAEVVSAASVTINNTPPSFGGAFITPESPNRNTTVKCVGTDYVDPDAEDQQEEWDIPDPDDTSPPGYAVEWWANGVLVPGADSPVWVPSAFPPQTELKCLIRPFDGQAFGPAVFSDAVALVNRVPEVSSAVLMPDPAYTNSELKCAEGEVSDLDDDPIELYYSWTRNGITIPAAASKFLEQPVSIGDEIACTITPYDGFAIGSSAISNTVTILNQVPSLGNVSVEVNTEGTAPEYNCVVDSVLDGDEGEDITILYSFLGENGEVLQEGSEDNTLSVYAVETGTMLQCEAVPYDGVGQGLAQVSASVEVPEWNPVITSVTLDPELPSRNTGVSCYVETMPLEGEADVAYTWYLNGAAIVGETTSFLSGNLLEKDVDVACVASLMGTVETAITTVQNSPPAPVSVTITPANPGPATPLLCGPVGALSDSDGDGVTVSYEWSGDEVTQIGEAFDGGEACSTVTCMAVPSDGTDLGAMSEASVVIGADTVLQLDGVSPGTVDTSLSPHTPNSAFTAEVWVRFNNVGEAVLLEWADTYAPGGTGFGLWITPGGQPAVVLMTPSQNQVFVEASNAALLPEVWTHIATTFSDGTLRIWKDGQPVALAAGMDLNLIDAGALQLRVGGSTLTSVGVMSGFVDDIRLSLMDRYGEAAFLPDTSHEPDEDTWMLIDFDGGSGVEWSDPTSGLTLSIPQGAGGIVGVPCDP